MNVLPQGASRRVDELVPGFRYHGVRRASQPYVVCTPICQEDFDLWVDQFLANVERLGLEVAWYADGLLSSSALWLGAQRSTVGVVTGPPMLELGERVREATMEVARRSGAEWWVRLDSDERLEPNDWDEAVKLMEGVTTPTAFDCPWYNFWNTSSTLVMADQHMSPRFNTRRTLHCMKWGTRWHFPYHRVASAYSSAPVEIKPCDLRVLHYGFSTPELRAKHKERWDKIYDPNPYGMWDSVLSGGAALEAYDPAETHQDFMNRTMKE